MKKFLLLLVAFLGIGFAANAQSCNVGKDTYVAVQAYVDDNQIHCKVTYNGQHTPKSGTVYVTVYYINTEGKEDSEMITLNWNEHYTSGYLGNSSNYNHSIWVGYARNVERIKRWEVSAGACRIE